MFKYLEKEDFLSMMLLPDIAALLFIMSKFLMLFFIFILLSFINKNMKNQSLSQWFKLLLKYTAFYLNIKLVISILLHVIYSTLL